MSAATTDPDDKTAWGDTVPAGTDTPATQAPADDGESESAGPGAGRPCPTDVHLDAEDVTKASFEDVCAGLWRTVNRQPEHREIYVKTLTFCDEERLEPAAEAYVQSLPEFAHETQSPYYLLAALVRAGGLERLELDEEGEPITPERTAGLSADEADDLVWSIAYRTTAAGMTVCQDMQPATRLRNLVQIRPEREDTYRDVLEFCLDPKPRREVERLLTGRPVLAGEGAGGEPLLPSVFIDKLERSGALVWEGAWVTSEAGKAYLEERARA